MDLKRAHNFGIDSSSDLVQEHMKTTAVDELPLQGTFCPENPATTVKLCRVRIEISGKH